MALTEEGKAQLEIDALAEALESLSDKHELFVHGMGWAGCVCELAVSCRNVERTLKEREAQRDKRYTVATFKVALEFIQDCNTQDPALDDFEECPADHPNRCGACDAKHQIRAAIASAERGTS